MSEKFSRTSVTALYLIKNKQCAGFFSQRPELTEKFVIRYSDSGNSLYSFDDCSREFFGGELFAGGFDIAQFAEFHIIGGIEGRYYFRIVGSCDGSRRAAMECVAECEDFFPACGEGCQFYGVFIGLGSGVAEEEAVIVISARFAKLMRELFLQGVVHGV